MFVGALGVLKKSRKDSVGQPLREGRYVVCGDPSSTVPICYGIIVELGQRLKDVWVQTVYFDHLAEDADEAWNEGRRILTKSDTLIIISSRSIPKEVAILLKGAL